MKEADDATNGQQAPATPPNPPPEEDKMSKDMKGLISQGEPASEEPPPPPPPPPPIESYSDDDLNLDGTKEKRPPLSAESDTILNFTEKDSKLKMIALVAVIVIIIAIVGYLVLNPKTISSRASTSTTSILISTSNVPVTISQNFNTTYIGGLNTLYNYTGPAQIGNENCGKSKFEYGDSSYTKSLNATTTFYLVDTESTGACPLTITKYVITTPGFRVVSVAPSTPSTIPAGSSDIQFVIKIETPISNYTGPLSITIDEN